MHLVRLPCRANPATTRIAALAKATGDWLVMIDDDVEPAPDFLVQLAEILRNTPERKVVGARLPAGSSSYWARSVDLLNFATQQGPLAGEREWLYSAAWAMPRELYEQTGGFDPGLSIGEDMDLCRRIRAKGASLWYEPSLLAPHHHRRYSLRAATRYAWDNGGLARFLFCHSAHARLAPLAFIQHISSAVWTSMRWNAIHIPFYPFYLPGICWLAAVFALSLEVHRRKPANHRES